MRPDTPSADVPALLTRLSASPPASPGVEEARRLVREELDHPDYVATWWPRLTGFLAESIRSGSGTADLGPVLAGLAAVVVALVVIAFLLRWRRARSRAPAATDRVFAEPGPRSAADHRDEAQSLLARGRHGDALLEGFRALAATAVERRLLLDTPDLTAQEVSRALARERPWLTVELRRAAVLFDEVRYGDRTPSADDVEALLALGPRIAETADAGEVPARHGEADGGREPRPGTTAETLR